MTGPASPGGRELWGLLPEHDRARDNGDLASYLDALGEVLDLLRGAIQQRLADSFPDHPDVQPWVLPYLADLIDPRVVSADEVRRRAEIASAAFWRKTKGTLRMVEQVAIALGGFGWTDGTPAERPEQPVIVQEGFRRVAVTPRVPLGAPPEALADRRKLLVDPALPMGTVDFRFYSRRIADADPTAFRVANPHGVPCFPKSVEDLSARTPDLRTPSWRTGHAHPSRVLIYAVPHAGFFPPGWDLVPEPTGDDHSASGGVLIGAPQVSSAAHEVFTLTDCWLDGTLRVTAGGVRLVRCAIRELIVQTPAMVDPQGRPTGRPVLSATDCLFETVRSAGLAELTFCTLLGELQAPRVWTSDSLYAGAFTVPKPAEPWHKDSSGQYDGNPESAIRYCRVPPGVLIPEFVDDPGPGGPPTSLVPDRAAAGSPASLVPGRAAATPPIVISDPPQGPPVVIIDPGPGPGPGPAPSGPPRRLDFGAFRSVSDLPFFVASQFAVPGSGVLLPLSGPALEAGAEDGGELGAYHHRGHAVHARAVLDKLRDSLPVGQTAVVIPDPKLNYPPPTLKSRS